MTSVTAEEITKQAKSALASNRAYGLGDCSYYTAEITGLCADTRVVKGARAYLFDRFATYEELENGDIIGWFRGDHFNLTHEAEKMAACVNRWAAYFA